MISISRQEKRGKVLQQWVYLRISLALPIEAQPDSTSVNANPPSAAKAAWGERKEQTLPAANQHHPRRQAAPINHNPMILLKSTNWKSWFSHNRCERRALNRYSSISKNMRLRKCNLRQWRALTPSATRSKIKRLMKLVRTIFRKRQGKNRLQAQNVFNR